MKDAPHVLIVGGGFGGLEAAKQLKNSPFRVTLLDKRNFHLFQPLLYQVATGGLSPADIATPLRSIFRNFKNISVYQKEVTSIHPNNKFIMTDYGKIEFDTLIIATGSTHHYFGHDSWKNIAPGLKTIEDATNIRSRILQAFEEAEKESDPQLRQNYLTFVIVGGGPTGIELAGAIGELARHTMKNDFRNIQSGEARILLIEGAERILNVYPPELSHKAQKFLKKLNVEIMTESIVTDVNKERVKIKNSDQNLEIGSRTVLWAAGVKASSLSRAFVSDTDIETDIQGRLRVNKYCQIPQYPEIYVIGDLAHFEDERGKPLPGIAPVSMQQGRYVAKMLKRNLIGGKLSHFKYHNRGNLAVIGRKAAVAQLGKFKFSGYFAWLLWLFIHLMYIVGFENRLLIFIQWSYNYFTRNRSARLIANYNLPKE
ncbi:MAG: NAD(P)/FAD-dependent oxidoreductase [bacterium]|nr:MAG: NAD(P)/FAD-dependent oxidoreductase [bacterium]